MDQGCCACLCASSFSFFSSWFTQLCCCRLSRVLHIINKPALAYAISLSPYVDGNIQSCTLFGWERAGRHPVFGPLPIIPSIRQGKTDTHRPVRAPQKRQHEQLETAGQAPPIYVNPSLPPHHLSSGSGWEIRGIPSSLRGPCSVLFCCCSADRHCTSSMRSSCKGCGARPWSRRRRG